MIFDIILVMALITLFLIFLFYLICTFKWDGG